MPLSALLFHTSSPFTITLSLCCSRLEKISFKRLHQKNQLIKYNPKNHFISINNKKWQYFFFQNWIDQLISQNCLLGVPPVSYVYETWGDPMDMPSTITVLRVNYSKYYSSLPGV